MRRIIGKLAAAGILAAAAVLVAPSEATARSCFLDTVVLGDPHYRLGYHDALASDRLVLVEIVATSPDARGFYTGAVVTGVAEWGLTAEPEPFTMILDDGRRRSTDCTSPAGKGDADEWGDEFIVGLHESGYHSWTIVGDLDDVYRSLGKPTPLPRDPAAIERLTAELRDSRPLSARVSAALPFGLWTVPALVMCGAYLLRLRSRWRPPATADPAQSGV